MATLELLESTPVGSPNERRSPTFMVDHDGQSPLYLKLDDEGSTIVYLPAVSGLAATAEAISSLNKALELCETTGVPPPEDTSTASGRRQWWADFGMGWLGPRRWRRASWRLEGKEQLDPVLSIKAAVDTVVERIATECETNGLHDLARTSVSLGARSDAEFQEAGSPRAAAPRIRESFNAVLVNRYTDGSAGVKWHADDDRWYHCGHERTNRNDRSDIVIASVSLGAERTFEFRRKVRGDPNERRRLRFRLKSGSVLLMAGATQQYWQHTLPADPACASPRWNLTFRRVVTAEEDPKLLAVVP